MYNIMFGVFETSLIMAFAIVLLSLTMKLFKGKVSAAMRHIIWLFVAAVLLVPFRPIELAIPASAPLPAAYEAQADIESDLTATFGALSYLQHWQQGWYNFRNSPSDISGASQTTTPISDGGRIEPSITISAENPSILEQSAVSAMAQGSISLRSVMRTFLSYGGLFAFWVGGALSFVLLLVSRHRSFILHLKRLGVEVNDIHILETIEEIRTRLGIKRKIRLMFTPAITVPVLMGVFKPIIIVPKYVLEENNEKLYLMLLHEAVHIKRGDLISRLINLIALTVHWFNPIVHWMVRKSNEEAEYATDDAVLKYMGEGCRFRYSEILISSAIRDSNFKRGTVLAYGLTSGGKKMKKRLENIVERVLIPRWVGISCTLLLLAIVLAFTMVGCENTNDGDEDSSDFAFVAEFTSLSALADDLPNMGNVIIANNTVFFTSTSELQSDTLFRTTRIFALDLDEFVLAYLPNYAAASPPPDAQGGGVHISAMKVDADGNLWVVEENSFVEFDFPFHFNLDEADVNEIWEHVILRESSYNMRKLDSTGAELQSIDIDHIINTSDWYGIFSFHIDDNGNLFIGFGQSIYVLDAEGNTLFSLDTGGDFIMPNSFIRLSDSRTAFFDWGGTTAAQSLRAIDVQSKSWGEYINLPGNIHYVFSGFDEYLVIISDSISLSGIHIDTGELLPIINWSDSIGVPLGLGNVTLLQDGRIQFTTTTFEHGFVSDTELITLSRTPRDELPERITLTLTTDTEWLPWEFRDAVAEFNRTNAFYRIEINVIERSWHSVSDDLSRLALDIITGGGPDIIDITNMPFQQWAARGLFVDLYEFIDADPTINRDDILDVVLRNAETDGKLYQMFHGFRVSTLIGNPDVVGNEPGWTFGDLIAVLEANPQAPSAFGVFTDGMALFQKVFMNHIDNFVNWETGTVDFDNDNFIEFLEFSVELRRAFNWWGENRDDDGIPTGVMWGADIMERMVASGEIIILDSIISTFNSPYLIQRSFGKDFIFKGYPTDSGRGNSLEAYPRLAISANSENKQGAWEFIRMILSEEWQRKNYSEFAFTTNRIVFEEGLARARAGNEQIYWVYWVWPGDMREDPYAFADKTLALIDSAEGLPPGFDPILTIVFEGIDDIFTGRSTPQEAARIIQSRAVIFVAEQS